MIFLRRLLELDCSVDFDLAVLTSSEAFDSSAELLYISTDKSRLVLRHLSNGLPCSSPTSKMSVMGRGLSSNDPSPNDLRSSSGSFVILTGVGLMS